LSALPDVLAEHDVRVQFGGEFADQVCGHWVRITDWVRETSLIQLIARPRHLPFGPRDYGRWVKRRYLDAVGRPVVWMKPYVPPWARPEIKEEWYEWYEGFCKAHAEDDRPLKELAARAAGNIWVTMNWEGSSELGVRRSNPFWSREVLELAFRCHPHELLGPGVKRLLRDALVDDVPAANLERPDKGSWGAGRDDYSRLPVPSDPELPAGAERLVRSDLSPAELEEAWAVGSELMGAVRVINFLNENSHNLEPASAR